jgi:hypothetical protein
MSSMEHQEVDLSKPQNQDLIWDLDSIARRELAERFIKLFENRLCVYSESTRQLYTNYDLHFPSDLGRKILTPSTTPCMASNRMQCARPGYACSPAWY